LRENSSTNGRLVISIVVKNFEVDFSAQFEISELSGPSTEGFNCIAKSISIYEK